jgi:hypothetical protein
VDSLFIGSNLQRPADQRPSGRDGAFKLLSDVHFFERWSKRMRLPQEHRSRWRVSGRRSRTDQACEKHQEDVAMNGREPGHGRPDLKPGDEAEPGAPGTGENVCPDCGGSGEAENGPCPTCAGTGTVVDAIGGG